MKKLNQFMAVTLLTLAICGFGQVSLGATFTAVSSGNWSSIGTWGGSTPGTSISNADVIIIPAGISVALDNDVTVNNSLASISIDGTLTGTYGLTIASGTLAGMGSVNINDLNMGTAGHLNSTGSISINNFSNSQALLSISATINVANTVTLTSGVVQLNSGSAANLANNVTINMAGGLISVNGGSYTISGNYNLVYSGISNTIGLEAYQTGLQNLTINRPNSGDQINVTVDLSISGALTIQSGVLVLNGHNLNINGTSTTTFTGFISSTSASNIVLNGGGYSMGTLNFSNGGNTVGNITMNAGTGGTILLGSDVAVTGTLALNSGSFNLNGNTLTVGGTITSSAGGYINSNSNSHIVINGSGNVGTLTFDSTANSIGGITLNAATNGSVSLGSDVTVMGALALDSGTFNIGSHTLTLGGTFNASGTGNLSTTSNSNLIISSSGSVGILFFNSMTANLHSLTVDITGNGSVSLGANISLSATLALNNGALDLNGHDLTINGTVTSGMGAISSNNAANLFINGSGSMGTLAFTPGSNTVGNMTLNIGSGGNLSLGSDLVVSGTLALNNGSYHLNGHTLTLNGSISAMGTGTLSSNNSSSSLIVNGSGNVGTVTFASGANTIGRMTVNIGAGGSVSMGSDMIISGMLALNGGNLNMNGHNLTLNGTSSTSGGAISGSTSSNLILSGSANMGSIAFTSGSSTIHDLTLNIGSAGSASLASDLTIAGSLILTNGMMDIRNSHLIINSGGLISGGSVSSYIVTSGTGTLDMNLNTSASGMFPVGTANHYAPVSVTNHSATAGSFNVMARRGILANGTSGPDISLAQSSVNTSWDVSSSITTGANVDVEMFWDASMEVNRFDRTQAYVTHYTNGSWKSHATAAANSHGGGAYSLSLTGVTSFSPFAIFDKNTNVTGITDVISAQSINIYPNPATDVVNLGALDANADFSLVVYDLAGQLMMEKQSNERMLDISSLADGIYNIAITQRGTNYISKLVVAK